MDARRRTSEELGLWWRCLGGNRSVRGMPCRRFLAIKWLPPSSSSLALHLALPFPVSTFYSSLPLLVILTLL